MGANGDDDEVDAIFPVFVFPMSRESRRTRDGDWV